MLLTKKDSLTQPNLTSINLTELCALIQMCVIHVKGVKKVIENESTLEMRLFEEFLHTVVFVPKSVLNCEEMLS